MNTKIFLTLPMILLGTLSSISYAQRGGHGGYHGGYHNSYGHYGGHHGNDGCMEAGCLGAGCFGLGLMMGEHHDCHPHSVWVEGHWEYNQFGQQIWYPGYWRTVE